MKSPRHAAFTLIELLIVISIIAMLVAMLLPALGAARYRATMVQCLAKERMLGITVLTYTEQNKNWYPYRTVGMNGLMPNTLSDAFNAPATDDRAMFNKFMDINTQLICPFSPLRKGVTLNGTTTQVRTSYEMWFGTWIVETQNASKMLRVGERPRYLNAASKSFRFNVLAADYERDWNNATGSSYAITSVHPDTGKTVSPIDLNDASYILSMYRRLFTTSAARTRTPMERNILFDDGSAKAFITTFHDASMVDVPAYPRYSDSTLANIWMFLPPMD